MAIYDLFKKKPVNLLTMAYLMGITIFAGMSIGAHVVAKKVISEQSSSAKIINIAGRQRMLSQRIALFVNEAVNKNTPISQNEISDLVDLFERSHIVLRDGNLMTDPQAKIPEAVRAIYYNDPYNLDKAVADYIQNARIIIENFDQNSPLRNKAIDKVQSMANGDLLINLDLVVSAFEKNSEEKIENLSKIQEISIIVILIVLILEAFIVFRPILYKIIEYAEKIEKIAATDSLTKILNRRTTFEMLEKEIAKSKRYENPLNVLVCDIDYFKKINDTYGHHVGDKVLKHFAKVIKKALRAGDIFGRIGGEEFMVILPSTDSDDAKNVAEKLRQSIETTPYTFYFRGKKKALTVTASFGLTSCDKDEFSKKMYNRVDIAMYKAKNNGRNCIEEE